MVKRCDTCGFDKTDGCACYWDRLEEVFYGKKPTPRKIIEVASEAVNGAVAQIERERQESEILFELSKKESDANESRYFCADVARDVEVSRSKREEARRDTL